MKTIVVAVGVCLLSVVNASAQWVTCSGAPSGSTGCSSGPVGVGTPTPSANGALTLSRNQALSGGLGQLFLDSSATSGNFRSGFVLSNNLANKWIIGNDRLLNGTNDFFMYDAVANLDRFYISPA